MELLLQLIHYNSKFQGVERTNLQCISCRPKFICVMTFPTLCLISENGSREEFCFYWENLKQKML